MSTEDALTAIIEGTADFHRTPDTYYRAVDRPPAPVFRLADGGPWWCASHAAAAEVLSSPGAFRMQGAGLASPASATAPLAEHWLELSEGEPHRLARRLLGGVLAAHDPAAAIDAALADLRWPARDGEVELVADVVVPFWQHFLPDWLGLDEDRLAALEAELPALVAVLMDAEPGEEDRRAAAGALTALSGAVAGPGPGAGLAGALREQGLPASQVAAYLVNLVVDVSAVPISLVVSMARVLTDPVARQAATSGDRRAAALAECLRLDPPQTLLVRSAVQDHELAGAPICDGDTVVILVGLANRDPAAFAAPSDFRPERTETALTFGLGSHACLGRRLFLQLGNAVVGAILDRVPDPVPAGASHHCEQVGLRNIESLPARTADPGDAGPPAA